MSSLNQDKLRKQAEWMKNFDEVVMEFSDKSGWIHIKRKPEKEGWYVTVRVGFAGIYRLLDQWKDGQFQIQCLDGSSVVAYSKDPVEIPNFN